MKLKICGIKDDEALALCQSLGVNYVGLNFVPTSKRRIMQSLDKKRAGEPQRVGVFQNQDIEFVCEMAQQYDLDIVQLHGAETTDDIQAIKQHSKLSIWKALSANVYIDKDMTINYCNHCDLILFDNLNPGHGEVIENIDDLEIAIKCVEGCGVKIGIAGGVKANNIADFVSRYPNAYLLDTASGAERDGVFSGPQTQKLVENFNAAQKVMP